MSDLGFFLPIVAALFGAAMGSFLNVVIYRLPRESLSIARPRRSFCPECGHTLAWFENIPILSYLFLGGRCRECRKSIPLRYPLVEFLTLALFFVVTVREMDGFLEEGPGRLQLFGIYIVHLALVMSAIVVTFIDIDLRIIPNEINYGGVAAGIVLSPLLPRLHEADAIFGWLARGLAPELASLGASLAGAAAGAALTLLVAIAGKKIFRKDAMGMGDVKFMAFMGAFCGWAGCLVIFLLACLAGAAIGIGYRLATGKQEIPFGPFLSLGFVTYLLFREEVMTFITRTWPQWVNGIMS
jgi:leader peptidase (prepilin peptidase)/N-methyltransferase